MITVAISKPAPVRTRPATPAPSRAQWLAAEIIAMAEGCDTPAELLDRVRSWTSEEWSQIDLDVTAPRVTADQQAEVIAILAARCAA